MFSHLAGFRVVLQVDGCNANPKLAERGEVELASCWVYMQRNFLRTRDIRPRADRKRGAEAHCRILCDRVNRSAEEHRLIPAEEPTGG
ncbi:IS66 family transposase [Bradyrhizobium yuanmingense]|uniref:IS66 family transposase n=1 Tax=Bradyrhizobium yuanmingense TaxID=108015 RepID=UPI0023B96311|nr:hypothetical protein [Bradyrhizobium yuanmingense]MDF0578881.1 hypothetical protein [Bradyrhizobium yuanmingense]